MALNRQHKWTVILMGTIWAAMILFILLFLLDYLRLRFRKSKEGAVTTSDGTQRNFFYRWYLVSRNIYQAVATRKNLIATIVFIVVIGISMGYMKPESYRSLKYPKLWYVVVVANRFGFFACGLYPIIFMLSMKNSFLGLLLFSSYERLNILHRWLSYVAVLFVIVHTIILGIYFKINNRLWFLRTTRIKWGWAGMCCLILIGITSIPMARRKYYEFFFIMHHLMAIGTLLTTYYHYSMCQPYVKAAAAIYGFDRGLRCIRAILGYTTLTVEIVGDDLVVLEAKRPRFSRMFKWTAGNHIFLNIPSINFFQYHPFTIANIKEDNTVKLYISARQGFTRRLLEKANLELPKVADSDESTISGASKDLNKADGTVDMHGKSQKIKLRAFLEGPYGAIINVFNVYDSVYFFGAGVGVTFPLSLCRDVLRDHGKVRKVVFAFAFKKANLMDWMLELLDDCKNLSAGLEVELNFHVTREDVSALKSYVELEMPANVKILCYGGRPNMDEYAQRIAEDGEHSRCAFAICGPEAIINSTKRSMNKFLTLQSDVYQHYEAFDW
ncbi:ferric reductase transmembrane component [Schizosaccharomyces japonicus yFS275]|uniref:ferric-chelate reductase (NADPH) n=1 Tax=Schizosaccharomyces japonicus (strain yFS275 / FY16936) TaxID=402676 RepID=B6K7M7_SCHJY|nr:ferric reductase transmembrane component [Schizosaccharomyces japonicus yFS275]EEB09531.1 ferric reductase transmembrane component [Schizosaccharomyces japonicus yFS275]